MKELVIVLRWFIGFLTFLLGLMTLILFLKYIWDLVIIRNIILIRPLAKVKTTSI